MELLDTVAITWMSRYRRNPFPEKIVWKQDDVTHNRFYWLRDENPTEIIIVVSIEGQTISIDTTSINNFTIMLNDSILNMDKPVVVKYNEKEIFKGIVPDHQKSLKSQLKSIWIQDLYITVRSQL